jgi:hypothetical protein
MKNHRTGYFIVNDNNGFVMGWEKEKRDAEMLLMAKPGHSIFAASDVVAVKAFPGWYKIKCLRRSAPIY